jgi:hypothetical protein
MHNRRTGTSDSGSLACIVSLSTNCFVSHPGLHNLMASWHPPCVVPCPRPHQSMRVALWRQALAAGIPEPCSQRRCRTRILVGEKLVEHLLEVLITLLIPRTIVPGSLSPSASSSFRAVSWHFSTMLPSRATPLSHKCRIASKSDRGRYAPNRWVCPFRHRVDCKVMKSMAVRFVSKNSNIVGEAYQQNTVFNLLRQFGLKIVRSTSKLII